MSGTGGTSETSTSDCGQAGVVVGGGGASGACERMKRPEWFVPPEGYVTVVSRLRGQESLECKSLLRVQSVALKPDAADETRRRAGAECLFCPNKPAQRAVAYVFPWKTSTRTTTTANRRATTTSRTRTLTTVVNPGERCAGCLQREIQGKLLSLEEPRDGSRRSSFVLDPSPIAIVRLPGVRAAISSEDDDQ